MQPDERTMLRKNQFLRNLLGNPSCGSLDTLLRDADDLELPLRRRFHRIIVAEVETWGELLNRAEPQFAPDDRSEAYFVLSNICTDVFSMRGRCQVCFTDFQGRVVFWMDADDDGGTTAEFRQAAEYASRVTESEFGMVVTFSIGDWFEDLFHTFDMYQNTLNLMYYFRYLSSSQSVYTMERLPQKSASVTLSLRNSWEHMLLDTLQKGDFEGVKVLLQESFQKRFAPEAVSLPMFPQRHAAFRELLEATAAELLQRYPTPDVRLEDTAEALATVETATEQLSVMETLIDSVAARLRPGPQDPPPEWIHTLTAYVQTNYTDPNITVYQLAEMVGITPSYCTRIFRRYMGMSLLEYIQRHRVRRAIGLLRSGSTMVQAAQQAGFTCTQTLRRTLKQYRS